MVCRKERSEVLLQLITTVLLLCTSPPQAGDPLHLFFTLCHHFWHIGTTQQNELLHPYGTEQPAAHGDFLAFGPESRVAPVAWHEAVLLLAQIPMTEWPCCFDFQRQRGLCELRHRCLSPLHMESKPMALRLPQLALKGGVYSAGNSSLLNLKRNFQLNNLSWSKKLHGPFHCSLNPSPFSLVSSKL